jgi:hypothetical protein
MDWLTGVWDKYKTYLVFGGGLVTGWLVKSMMSSPTVIVQSPAMRGTRRRRIGR